MGKCSTALRFQRKQPNAADDEDDVVTDNGDVSLLNVKSEHARVMLRASEWKYACVKA